MKDQLQSKKPNESGESYLYYHKSGLNLLKQGKLAEAIEAFKEAIKLNPDYVWSHYDLGSAHAAARHFTDAAQAFQKAIELKPDYIWSYNNLGDVLSKIGRINRAKDCYREALKYELVRKMTNLGTLENKLEPNFMVIGFAKCGTTSLYEYIIQHPQIIPAAKKEIMYFSEYFHYGLDWYKSHFSSIADGKHMFTGEASAHYIDHPQAYKRIYKSYPNLKFIVLLRNPVKRTYSDYQMWKREGKENRAFEDVINAEMKRVKGEAQATFSVKSGWIYPSYLASSLYIYSLKRWMTLFPSEQFLILQTKELYSNPAKVLGKVFHFLGVDDYKIENYPKHNVGNYTPINDDMRNRLKEYFQPHNMLLEEFLGMKFNWDK